MVKAERAFKWGIAIVVIFGILNAFYFFNLVVALKIVLPLLCVFLIGSILLQSGKGGGLAAIGGLGDQSAFGTRTNTFITKITYLIGAAFIVTTIFLFKLSIPEKTIQSLVTSETQAEHHSHNHAAHDHDEKCEHDHEHAPHAGGKKDEGSGLGMQNVTGEKQTDAQSQTK